MKALLVFALFLAAVSAELTRYDGYKVYKIVPKDEQQLVILQQLRASEEYDFWLPPTNVGNDVNVMVRPDAQDAFVVHLDVNTIEYTVLIEDVESTFAEERQRQESAPKSEKGRIGFTQYYRYNDIQNYLKELAQAYPNIVSLEDFATSTEGRTLTVLKISTGNATKPAILIEGGIHAREWISPALVLYMINQLVENPANRNLIETTDWYIVPVLNPDGYEYSHTNTRLWRKTRSRGTSCYGVDGNRNFDHQWMFTGASSNECSETFAGRRPESEPEIAAFSAYVKRNEDKFKLHLSVHSYGQYLLYPWGWTTAYPSNAAELQSLGDKTADAIRAVANTRYTVGSSSVALYATSGSSVDWAMGIAGIQLTYTIELPGGGANGFDLPASRIVPVVQETWQGIVVLQEYVAEKYASKV